MPFTFSHPAYILFLKKLNPKFFSVTGLFMGAIAPDFWYFFQLKGQGTFAMEWQGVLFFDVPLAVGLSIFWHKAGKQSLIPNLPSFLQRRYQYLLHINFLSYLKKHKAVFIISVLLGIVSHLITDHLLIAEGITLGVPLSVLTAEHNVFGYTLPASILFERALSVTGLLIMIVVLLKSGKPDSTKSIFSRRDKMYFYIRLTFIAMVPVLIRAFLAGFPEELPQWIIFITGAYIYSFLALSFMLFVSGKLRCRVG